MFAVVVTFEMPHCCEQHVLTKIWTSDNMHTEYGHKAFMRVASKFEILLQNTLGRQEED